MYNSNERYQLHWATIFVSSLRLLREMILPIVVLIALNAFKDGLDGRGFLIMAGIGFASFSVLFIASVLANFIRWSRFTYWFEEDELRIESGVFVRNKRYIPFERMQGLNYTEPLVHLILGQRVAQEKQKRHCQQYPKVPQKRSNILFKRRRSEELLDRYRYGSMSKENRSTHSFWK